MSEVKWIRIVTDIFDDEKMLLIESMPAADSIIVIWFKLLALAGKSNNDGVFLMNGRMPYTDEMLATIFRKDVNTVRLALKTFEDLDMIEKINGVVTISNWGKYQNFDKINARKEYMKNYMRERRSKQKALIDASLNLNCYSDVNTNVNVNSKQCKLTVNTDVNVNNSVNETFSKQNVSSLDIDKKDININISKDILLSHSEELDNENEPQENNYYKDIKEAWNSLANLGIPTIRDIKPNTNRAKMLRTRLKQEGKESFFEIIEQIKSSDFLQGRIVGSNKKPFLVDFDWVIHPTNYQRILEGKYRNREQLPQEEPNITVFPKVNQRFNTMMQEPQKTTDEWAAFEAQILDN